MNKNWPRHAWETFTKYAKRENEVFRQLDHPNIVKYIDTININEYYTCTVLEYCEGKDLDYQIKSKKKFTEI